MNDLQELTPVNEDEKSVKNKIITKLKELNSNIDFKSFFLAPLYVLIMLEIMHLCNIETYAQFFKTPFFLFKWFISYVFLLLIQGTLLVIIPNLFAVHTIEMIFFFALGFVNEVLLKITGDPFLPSDFFLVDNVGSIASFVEIPLLAQCVISALFAVFSIIHFFRRHKKRKSKIKIIPRIVLSVLVIASLALSVNAMCFNRIVKYRFFTKCDINIAAFNPKADYLANGLILTFFPRIGELVIEAPDGYTQQKIAEIKSKEYPHLNASETDPNIIAIQSEALWDITLLPNTTFHVDPMINMRAIAEEKNAKMGTLVSPVFGGGTCMPEFEFLTGFSTNYLPASVYPYIQAVTKPTPSLVSSYKENGYQTFALHPYQKNFYGRDTAYPLLGFDTFLGDEDLENPEVRGFYISDMEVTRQLISAYENKTSDRLYAYAVTMQNHGGYDLQRYASYDVNVDNPALNAKDLLGIREFTQGVFDADVAFGALVDYFRNVDEPTIIVMYGDHLPLMGIDGSTYTDSGYVTPTDNGFATYEHPQLYETPYIIWANYDVDLSAIPDRLSAAKLGLGVYSMAGLTSVPWYYEAISNFYDKYPVYTPLIVENSEGEILYPNDNPTLKADEIEYKQLQYDLLLGEKYALDE